MYLFSDYAVFIHYLLYNYLFSLWLKQIRDSNIEYFGGINFVVIKFSNLIRTCIIYLGTYQSPNINYEVI